MMKFSLTAALIIAAMFGIPISNVNAFPDKPVKVIVPFPPGGPADVLMRAVGDKLAALWKQPVVIDNKAGASGIIAAQAAAQAPADGHTLFFAVDSNLVANRFLFKKLPYDPQKDFQPVTTLVVFNGGLVVNTAKIPARNMRELVDLLKANPGKFSYGSFGVGTSPHLSMELFKSLTGVEITHVPYKGLAQVAIDFRAGLIDMAYVSTNGLSSIDQGGLARVIAMDGDQRSALLPDVPTFREAGLKGMDSQVWFGILVPAATPRAVVDRLQKDIVTVLHDPEISEKSIRAKGYFPVGNTPEEFSRLIDQSAAVWGPLIKKTGITLD